MVIKNIRPTPEQMKEWGEKEGADWSFETEADRKKIADRFIRFLSFAKISCLKDKKLQNVLEKESTLKELILSLSFQEFLEMITGVNHLVRNIDDRKVWSADGANVKMGEADMFPDQESKVMLIEEAFLIAKKNDS